ncbi:MAG: hypothetical protein R3E87_14955 [Burkholderiaceae bacterium]
MSAAKPKRADHELHTALVVSKRQVKRMKEGRMESRADDYAHLVNRDPAAIAKRDARHRLEEMQWKKDFQV